MIQKLKCESAVSPVIGTILLVAITVVLVAIIAAVVMGLGSTVSSTKEVGLTVTQIPYVSESYSNLILGVRVYGGADVSNLRSLTVNVEGSPLSVYIWGPESPTGLMNNNKFWLWERSPAQGDKVEFKGSEIIGQTFYYTPAMVEADDIATFENALCTVTGTFADGTSQVLYKTHVTHHAPEGSRTFWAIIDQESWDLVSEDLEILSSPILN